MKDLELNTVHALLNHAVDSYSNANYQASLTTIIQAANAAQHLEPRDHALEFRVFFYKMINHSVLKKWSLAFSSSLQCMHLIENHHLIMDDATQEIALCYFGSADAAMHLPHMCASAIPIHEKGMQWCQNNASEFLLLAQHLKAKLLIGLELFHEAVLVAEQTLAQKELRPAAFGCPLSCYQAVYIEALSWAKRPKDALRYVDRVVVTDPNIALLWFEKAKLHFRAGDYQLSVVACQQALWVRATDAECALLCAQAHMLLQQPQEALSVLKHARVYHPEDLKISLWFFLWNGELVSALKRNLVNQSWLSFVCLFVLGEYSLPKLLAQAKKQDEYEQCLGQSYCFAALQSSEKTAQTYYQYCLQHSAFNSNEFLWATACLKMNKHDQPS
ncbi:MAG: hypothetical protein Q9M28_00995 [Mariprofundaceae bacterium]|nr:hypothetical protein [Mariprofundaceae bacterium]